MCWKSSKKPKLYTVPKGKKVQVYKIMSLKRRFFFFKKLFSYFLKCEYKLNQVYFSDIYISKFYAGKYYIQKGIHSYSVRDTSILAERPYYIKVMNGYIPIGIYFLGSIVKVYGYLPEGTQYYINELGEIVSNKIILTNYEKIK
jgi:hypothetical protein